MSPKEPFREIFRIVCDGDKTLAGLMKAGKYDCETPPLISAQWFPLKPHPPEERWLVFVPSTVIYSFMKRVDRECFDITTCTLVKIRDFLDKHRLELPEHEDAFHFGVRWPNEQRKQTIIFPHRPVVVPGEGRHILTLGQNDGQRYIFYCPDNLGWESDFVKGAVFALIYPARLNTSAYR